MISVNALFYGDHANIANRLLHSLEDSWPDAPVIQDVRIGLNAASSETRDLVFAFCKNSRLRASFLIFESKDNVGKYPLMRRMFYDVMLAPLTMWFDDDSWLGNCTEYWWHRVGAAMSRYDQIGRIHSIIQRGRQFEVIQQQPWYKSKSVSGRHRFQFITGGWWTIHTRLIRKWDYPFPALHHNGGDSILGEVARQQDWRLGSFENAVCHCQSCSRTARIFPAEVVHINDAPRRGLGVTKERYVWSDGVPHPSLTHQDFAVHRTEFHP